MLDTKKVPGTDGVVAVSFDGPIEIYLRKSGRANFGKEERLVNVEDGKLFIDRDTAKKFGLEIVYRN